MLTEGTAMTVTIYHNPACGTSRNVLAMIRNSGEEPRIIEYLKTPPSRAELVDLIARMGITPRQLLRRKGTPYDELGLDDPKFTDDQLDRSDDRTADPDQPADRRHAAGRQAVPAVGDGARYPGEPATEAVRQGRRHAGRSTREDDLVKPRRSRSARDSYGQRKTAMAARQPATTSSTGAAVVSRPALGVFERYLTLWVALCIVVGIALGHLLPAPFQAIGRLEVAQVNLPVAVLIWLMIIPMLMKIDFAALAQVKEHWRGMGVTLFINWGVKPFSMALLGWLFIGWLFRPYLPAEQIDSYIAGLIILAAAPCTAMVFVWSNLSGGEPHFTLSQVALNDTIMIFAFAPLVGLLLGISAITVPWETLFLSVVLFIVIPVIIAQVWRRALLANGAAALAATLKRLGPVSLIALLATLVLLFAFQGEQILAQPLIIVMLAVPILIQVYFNSGLAYWLNRRFGEAHCVAAPSALIGASNFFELAVATAIGLFGFNSGAALATVVGVLVEVPVMLSVVRITTATKGWYERGLPAAHRGAPAHQRR